MNPTDQPIKTMDDMHDFLRGVFEYKGPNKKTYPILDYETRESFKVGLKNWVGEIGMPYADTYMLEDYNVLRGFAYTLIINERFLFHKGNPLSKEQAENAIDEILVQFDKDIDHFDANGLFVYQDYNFKSGIKLAQGYIDREDAMDLYGLSFDEMPDEKKERYRRAREKLRADLGQPSSSQGLEGLEDTFSEGMDFYDSKKAELHLALMSG
jgi:hypothetical protein